MPTIQYPNHPNTDTAFVVQDDGTKNRALMTAPQDTSTLELPKNANSCKGYVTINGKKQRVVMTADVMGGGLPDQTGQSGKFLTTDGTGASWSDSIKFTGNKKITLWSSGAYGFSNLILGYNGSLSATEPTNGVKLSIDFYGFKVIDFKSAQMVPISASKIVAPQIAKTSASSVIDIPNVAGEMAVQVSSLPTAASTNEGEIYQFVGTTDGSYTNGHFYKCVSDGQDPATYSWEEVQLGGGGSSYTAGNGISITNNEITVTDPVLVNRATSAFMDKALAIGPESSAQTESVQIGYKSKVSTGGSEYLVCIGANTGSSSSHGIAIGHNARVGLMSQYAIQLGSTGSLTSNSDADTFKVANRNGNFEIMSADGTIPAARHAVLPSADGTYVLKLVIANGVPTLSWVAE